jgi:hypothetical protein
MTFLLCIIMPLVIGYIYGRKNVSPKDHHGYYASAKNRSEYFGADQ